LEVNEVNELFNSLPDLDQAAAVFTSLDADGLVEVTGNPGVQSCDKGIAINKGWTVVP